MVKRVSTKQRVAGRKNLVKAQVGRIGKRGTHYKKRVYS
jgi:hypothetical protein